MASFFLPLKDPGKGFCGVLLRLGGGGSCSKGAGCMISAGPGAR